VTSSSSEVKYSWLSHAIAANTDIVTASRRLARDLAGTYDEQQLAAGNKAWLTPRIWFWQDWLARQLTASAEPAAVPGYLDSFASTVLWERCLKRRMPDGLLSLGGIVRQAGQAWQRISDWNISSAELSAAAGNLDEKLFAAAAVEYQQFLDEGNWVDGAGMAALVANLVEQSSCAGPSTLVLAGFDRLNPGVERVVSALREQGTEVVVRPAPAKATTVKVVDFDQEAAELRAAGAWAREALRKNAQAKVGIVCTGLESHAAEVTRLVREGLAPGWQYGSSHHRAAANVSYGRRLSEYPAVAIALLVLRWTCHGLSSRELSVLLRSRCIASDSLAGRSRLELGLRNYPDREWTAENVLQIFATNDTSAGDQSFIDLVKNVASLSRSGMEKGTPADCVRQIDQLLTSIHWPGEASLNSQEFQLVNRWRELLNEFARVESVAARLDLTEAIQRVAALASDTIWQPETEPGVVQVMGELEAAGMEFDHLWVTGLDASQWPSNSRPSPFISRSLQQTHGMPDATPGDTLQFSKQVLTRLTGAAGHCVLSWSRNKGDSELTASTLLDGVNAKPCSGQTDPGWYAMTITGTGATVTESDDDMLPVGVDERVRGGAYTVQRQFEEPFSAFVFGRLGVRPPEPFSTGLSPGVRGNIIHNALHNLLSAKPARDELAQWSGEERSRRIGSAIDTALAQHTRHADAIISRLIGLERGRLLSMLGHFLDAEARRDQFSVADVEKNMDYERYGVRLGLRIDRIDQLGDGRQLVVDYKTGKPKHFLNKDGDLTDLQLTVYADALGGEIGGMVFINIDSREISYKGAGGGWAESDQPGWEQKLNAWRAEVHGAMKSLADGDARINLRQSASDGRALNILSRLQEQQRVD